MAEGITRKAICRKLELSLICNCLAKSWSLLATLDIAGSSAAETDIPNRLSGRV